MSLYKKGLQTGKGPLFKSGTRVGESVFEKPSQVGPMIGLLLAIGIPVAMFKKRRQERSESRYWEALKRQAGR